MDLMWGVSTDEKTISNIFIGTKINVGVSWVLRVHCLQLFSRSTESTSPVLLIHLELFEKGKKQFSFASRCACAFSSAFCSFHTSNNVRSSGSSRERNKSRSSMSHRCKEGHTIL